MDARPIQFNIRSITIATTIVAIACCAFRLFVLGENLATFEAAWLSAGVTFVVGFFAAIIATTWQAVGNNATARNMATAGFILMASVIPVGLSLMIVFDVLEMIVILILE